jgi:hypothetical protein
MRIMVHCYCRAHHEGISTLCVQCQNLLDYATRRLERCRFKADKPTCAKCPVHCYQSHWRQQMKEVMRYAGLHMLWQHPILSLFHLWDGFRSKNIRASWEEWHDTDPNHLKNKS